MPSPRVALGPQHATFATDAIVAGGGTLVDINEEPDALVWLDPMEVEGLAKQVAGTPTLRWVQLPFAGVEKVLAHGLIDHDHLWTCAKGSYAEPVAEHALALSLAGLRHLPTRIAARSWGQAAGTSLYDQRVTILGGGGITAKLLEQLAPFRVEATVVRRKEQPMPGAARTVPVSELDAVLPGSLVVYLALALTPETTGIIGARQLDRMDDTTWLVNVARGPHVDTDALVAALGCRLHRRGGARRDRSRAAARRPSPLGAVQLHHHTSYRGHHRDDPASPRRAHPHQRGSVRGRPGARGPGRPRRRVLTRSIASGRWRCPPGTAGGPGGRPTPTPEPVVVAGGRPGTTSQFGWCHTLAS